MPSQTHLVATARQLKQQLNGHAFLTVPRTQITYLLREISGEPGARIKARLSADLTSALVNQGVQVYPSLGETTTGDTVRLYHAGSASVSSSTRSSTQTPAPTPTLAMS